MCLFHTEPLMCVCLWISLNHIHYPSRVWTVFLQNFSSRPHLDLGMLRKARSEHGLDLPLPQTKTFSLFFLLEWLYFLPLMHACFSQREELELRFPRTLHRREVWNWLKRLSPTSEHQHIHVCMCAYLCMFMYIVENSKLSLYEFVYLCLEQTTCLCSSS